MYFLLFVSSTYLNRFFSIYVAFRLEDFISCINEGFLMYYKYSGAVENIFNNSFTPLAQSWSHVFILGQHW